jgi:rhamnose utilization protein RhaD (predicted bifunctional aldolase and dehydrogenase)
MKLLKKYLRPFFTDAEEIKDEWRRQKEHLSLHPSDPDYKTQRKELTARIKHFTPAVMIVHSEGMTTIKATHAEAKIMECSFPSDRLVADDLYTLSSLKELLRDY